MYNMIWNRKGFPGGAVVKHLPANAETLVPSLGWEDPLEKEMATHSNILARKIPWREEPDGLQSGGSQRGRHDGAHKHVGIRKKTKLKGKGVRVSTCFQGQGRQQG